MDDILVIEIITVKEYQILNKKGYRGFWDPPPQIYAQKRESSFKFRKLKCYQFHMIFIKSRMCDCLSHRVFFNYIKFMSVNQL